MRTYIILSLLITLTSHMHAAEKAPEKKTQDASTQTENSVKQPCECCEQLLNSEEAQKLSAAFARLEAAVERKANEPCIIQ